MERGFLGSHSSGLEQKMKIWQKKRVNRDFIVFFILAVITGTNTEKPDTRYQIVTVNVSVSELLYGIGYLSYFLVIVSYQS